MKKIFISITLPIILFSNETKQELFEDKYLKNKEQLQSQISVDELHKNSKDLNLSYIQEVKNKDFNKTYENIEFIKNTNASKNAEQISSLRRSEKMQDEVLKNENYILHDKNFSFEQNLGEYSNYTKNMIKQMEETKHLISTNKYLNPNEKIFIIISSSLKDETIRNYFKLLENVNTDITFVLRGLVGNDLRYIKPTQAYIQNLLIKNQNSDLSIEENHYKFNIEINPKITQRFDIKKVPAVLYIQNYNPIVQDYQNVIGEPDKDEKYFVAYGEASIDYALEQINKEVKSSGIERLLENMKNNFYK
ncbi:type-F conjugative transfer system pilin assembly protein TrbC [Campylobacter insulaenigrae]|uniref:TrbC family F-type conjugative pilus assembly protein n=1 Tax=Campylobacter insulaenigrae TaxID=260714 RepID=UPI000F6E1E71|nr:TrbC family F-type conjugative pilus assembly protein [Campylobacter insulaenigrae]MCR6574299.1 type-F conjugative transfer system pilin assembly protein TrbC [Campylobacter insulaenigrae]MCR6591967.1 type-F conjugative transfer system pilin assembly protein TrbC [Campylobacter insulaenigrae]MCR6592030.1 type-F conjugative transfer system pilin assembly protein TrbC [Campylobacter insulaenigrae]VEJ53291.1 type-F conjugative transfer system pilin assembly protein TrbC [Campylobacter insulaeni